MAKKIVLFGPISVGKGWCMDALKNSSLDVDFIGLGDHFRNLKIKDPEFREKYGEKMDMGELLPDKLTIEHTLQLLDDVEKNAVIIDGAVRTATQVRLLEKAGKLSSKDLVLVLNASTSTCKKRHEHRVISKLNGNRVDDAWFNGRMEIFNKNRGPVITALSSVGVKIINVNANRELPEVSLDVITTVKHFLNGSMVEYKTIPTRYSTYATA